MLPGRLIFDRPTKSIRFPQSVQSTDVATQNDSYPKLSPPLGSHLLFNGLCLMIRASCFDECDEDFWILDLGIWWFDNEDDDLTMTEYGEV